MTKYYFYGLDNEIHCIEADPLGGYIMSIHNKHCPLCGCKLAVYNGDPHYVVECPNCKINEDDLKTAIKEEEENINELTEKLYKANQRLNVFKRKNNVYKKNMEDIAMKEQK